MMLEVLHSTVSWDLPYITFSMYIKTVLLSLALVFTSWRFSSAQSETKITASDGEINDSFGSSASLSGDYALIGAWRDAADMFTTNSGSAYVFKREGTTWVEEAKLTAARQLGDAAFGQSVSLRGDYALVGAPADFSDDVSVDRGGAVYVFRREDTTWIEEAKLIASDIASSDRFGRSVSLSGDYILVGSSRDDDRGIDSGAAYVFRREGTTWIEEAKLSASDGANSVWFGTSVSLNGDYALIGAARDNSSDGAAYVFRREGTTWIEEAKLIASDAEGNEAFGRSVSLDGDYALVGADEITKRGSTNAGSAYVFRREGTIWIEEAKLTASDGASSDRFGWSVSLNNGKALIGAALDDDLGNESGAAYIFRQEGTSWIEETKLTASDGTTNGIFGSSVSLSSNYAVVGAEEIGNETDSGSAYVYLLTTGTSTENTRALADVSILNQNYPNPTNKLTTIPFFLQRDQSIRLELFDLLGRKIKLLSFGNHVSGRHEVLLDTSGLPRSVYVYRLSTEDGSVQSKILTVMK